MASSDNSSPRSVTSSSWLRLLKAREPQAWRRLTELYGPLVFHLGQRHGLSPEDSGDLVQEVFSAVAAAVDRFVHSPDCGTFRGCLWTIARNKLRDHFRRTADREQADGGTTAWKRLADLPENWSDESHDVSDPSELSLLFRRALDRVRCEFENRTWQAFWLSTVDQQDTADVAQQLGLSANSVRQAKSRVLRRLRCELGDGQMTKHPMTKEAHMTNDEWRNASTFVVIPFGNSCIRHSVVPSLADSASAFIPKGLRHIAQGYPRTRATLGCRSTPPQP